MSRCLSLHRPVSRPVSKQRIAASTITAHALAATFTVTLTWAAPSAAQTSGLNPPSAASAPSTPQAVAAGHFERGVELYKEGSFDAALVEFERAYEAVPDYRVLYNLAQVQMQRGEYVGAIDLFERYLREGGENVPDARKTEVQQDLAKCNGRVAKLWVESNVTGAELYVNEKPAGVLPLQQPVVINSGVCQVRLVKPGFESRSHQLKVAGGEQPRLSLPLTAIASNAANTASPPTGGGSAYSVRQEQPSYAPFWISVAATVAFGGAAGSLGYLAIDSKQKLDDELDRFPADRDVVEQRSNEVKEYSLWGDVCGAAAVVAAGSALYFLISPPTTVSSAEQPLVSSLKLHTTGTSAVLSGKF